MFAKALRGFSMFGTATAKSATKVLLLGSGELGKEVAIEALSNAYNYC